MLDYGRPGSHVDDLSATHPVTDANFQDGPRSIVPMPIYECSCEACGITFEILAPVSEANRKRPCPRCARPSRRVVSAFAIGNAQSARRERRGRHHAVTRGCAALARHHAQHQRAGMRIARMSVMRITSTPVMRLMRTPNRGVESADGPGLRAPVLDGRSIGRTFCRLQARPRAPNTTTNPPRVKISGKSAASLQPRPRITVTRRSPRWSRARKPSRKSKLRELSRAPHRTALRISPANAQKPPSSDTGEPRNALDWIPASLVSRRYP